MSKSPVVTRRMLRAKLHGATVTAADVEYEGSLTIPPELMELADLKEYESIEVWNLTNGNRFETYVIEGAPQSDDICVNGAAAHLAKPGDKLIIAAFAEVREDSLDQHKPILVFLKDGNTPVVRKFEVAGP